MAKHIFDSAHEWLASKIQQLESAGNAAELANMFRALLAGDVDNDQIQDTFQREMSDEGFFVDLESNDWDEFDPVGQSWPLGACLEMAQRLGHEPATLVDVNAWRERVAELIEAKKDEVDRAAEMYAKGYRYRLQLHGVDAPETPLYVKSPGQVGPLLRKQYPNCTATPTKIDETGNDVPK